MTNNRGPDKWQPQQVITHRLDPNLLYRIDYFLMLFAKSVAGGEAVTEQDKARMAALTEEGKALADRVKAIDDAQP